MWHLWRRKTNGGALAEAKEKRIEEERKLDEVEERWQDVQQLSAALRRHREANHFTERIMDAVRGHPS